MAEVRAGFAATDLPRRFGRYTLLRRIAKGGMGEVLQAATLGVEGAERPVIIKMIRAEHRTDASFNARFLDEARVQAQLSHSGVAQVFEATTDEDSREPYVVVEYVEGRSLGDVRQRSLQVGYRFVWHEAVALVAMIAEALAYVHECTDAQGRSLGIVHRDLSPQNVMVSYAGEVKLIDFGTARGQNRRCHTVSGVVFAKPGYVAPEVANNDPGDFRVDLYALGVMLWELCKNQRFLEGDAAEHLAKVAAGERNLPRIAEELKAPAELDAILERLTNFDREKRYDKSRDAARDLCGLLVQSPSLATGERGIRARATEVMGRLFPGEPARMRREFLKLVAVARERFRNEPSPAQRETPARPVALPVESGSLLEGTRFRLLRQLGDGGSSVVFEAEHLDLDKRVAIKVAEEGKKDANERVRHEARILGKVAGPACVALLDVGQTPHGRAFSVLELLRGTTVARIVADGTEVLSERGSLEIVRRLLEALEIVHAQGVVHRDVKPENVMVLPDGAVKLLDFGIATSKKDGSDAVSPAPEALTIELFGTPEYMAPEQIAQGFADARSDIYAVGSMLYQMLTGQLPFVADSRILLLEMKSQGSPIAPSERAPSRKLSRDVDELVLRALSRHANLRFETAREMRLAVEACLAAPLVARRRRRTFGAVALAMTLLGSSSVVMAQQGVFGAQPSAWLANGKARVVAAFTRAPEAIAEDPADVDAATAVAVDEGAAPAAAPPDPDARQREEDELVGLPGDEPPPEIAVEAAPAPAEASDTKPVDEPKVAAAPKKRAKKAKPVRTADKSDKKAKKKSKKKRHDDE